MLLSCLPPSWRRRRVKIDPSLELDLISQEDGAGSRRTSKAESPKKSLLDRTESHSASGPMMEPFPLPPPSPSIANTAAPSKTPLDEPPEKLWAWFTHEGGAGGLDKENQDTCCAMRLSADVDCYAVFDGHGKQCGQLAALAARDALRAFLQSCGPAAIADVPAAEATLRRAFVHMHSAIRTAMAKADPTLRLQQEQHGGGSTDTAVYTGGDYLLKWMAIDDPDEGAPSHKWDAVDGGTTASVCLIRRNEWLLTAAVGDSSAILMAAGEGARLPASGAAQANGEVVVELIVDEHSPTNAAEFVRMRAYEAAHPCSSGALQFVYDCPDLTQYDIFGAIPLGGGLPPLDRENEKLADEHEVNVKVYASCVSRTLRLGLRARACSLVLRLIPRVAQNSRGDLFTVINIPEMTLALTPLAPLARGDPRATLDDAALSASSTVVEEQAITMTRSLGDFYAHLHGCSCEPELRLHRISELRARALVRPRIVLASDGVWDLWTFEEVHEQLEGAERVGGGLRAAAPALCEATRSKGAEYFDEGADNLTGILVDLGAYLGGDHGVGEGELRT